MDFNTLMMSLGSQFGGADDLVMRGPVPTLTPNTDLLQRGPVDLSGLSQLLTIEGPPRIGNATALPMIPGATPAGAQPMAPGLPNIAERGDVAGVPQQGRSKKDLILQIAPMIISAFMSRKDPHAAAGLLQGYVRGQQVLEQQRMRADEKEQRRKETAARFLQQVAADAAQFSDPVEFAAYLKFTEEVAADSLGIPRGTITAIPFPKTKAAERVRKAAADRLAQIEKDERWKDKIGTPEFENGVSVEIPGVGRKTISETRDLAGLQTYDASGQAIAPPVLKPKPTDRHLQRAEVSVNGRKVWANYDPHTGAFTDLSGNPLPNAEPVPRAARTPRRQPPAADANDPELVETVMANPVLWHQLTPVVRTRIAPKLAARGFNFARVPAPRRGRVSSDPADAAVEAAVGDAANAAEGEGAAPLYRWPDGTTRAYPAPADAQRRPPRPFRPGDRRVPPVTSDPALRTKAQRAIGEQAVKMGRGPIRVTNAMIDALLADPENVRKLQAQK